MQVKVVSVTEPADMQRAVVVWMMLFCWCAAAFAWMRLDLAAPLVDVGIGSATGLLLFLFRELRIGRTIDAHVRCVAGVAIALSRKATVFAAAARAWWSKHYLVIDKDGEKSRDT